MGSRIFREVNFQRPELAQIECLSKLCPVVLYCDESHRGPWVEGERKLMTHLWFFMIAGEGVLTVGGKEFQWSENTFIWLPPNIPYSIRGTSKKTDCLYALVDLFYSTGRTRVFQIPDGFVDLAPFLQWISPPARYGPIDSLCGPIPLLAPFRFQTMFQELIHTWKSPLHSEFKTAGLLLEMIDEVLTSVSGKDPVTSKLRNAEAYIRENLAASLNVEILAQRTGWSAAHFRRMFARKYGKSPVAFHRELRMQAACDLLLNRDRNVSEVAAILGFHSVQSFSRAFIETMHRPPKYYRRFNVSK